ncbi:5-methyltetrahydropteroyltriglutamate--homocysteine S-methyltransferase [Paenibacillus senegalensis]|uniref:5-methyltetrahydropteroyltriglutamate-- homocysteine S-methyltransferase n=1 Tax=Paenibacillus senegalensis TaxID=1465766 RepID=UPI000474715F|nr:5-methyltetrahydropteroyltriglutamate--homocysteine S-methyltransferase [Paenibacillus senegalensis]
MNKKLLTGNLGYPRIGAGREWKRCLEGYWAGKRDLTSFYEEMNRILIANLNKQKSKGLDFIPVNDFTFYDHMLDMAVMFGVVPPRYGYDGGEVSLDTYFAMARGSQKVAACEMTKWFNTNYHYIVPEIGEREPELTVNRPLKAYRFAKQEAGIEGRPVVVGLYTFLKLSKGFPAKQLEEQAERFLPAYIQMLQELEQEGVAWVQLDEPALVTDCAEEELKLVEHIYYAIAEKVPGLRVMLQTYFEAVDALPRLVQLPVAGIGLDFVHDGGRNLAALEKLVWPKDKMLGAGIIDGRNVWRSDLTEKSKLLRRISQCVAPGLLIVQPSCSLLHVPVSADSENSLPPVIHEALAFADEKLEEVRLLSSLLAAVAGKEDPALQESRDALADLNRLPERSGSQSAKLAAQLADLPDTRSLPYQERVQVQQAKWKLPLLPTTTIGSFPQTAEVRQARQKWRKKEWEQERYEAFMKDQIQACIKLQEELGIDVLVHGEFERTDMVEFFGEKLGGFVFTRNGWVQSYGSRCVKPPIIYGDVTFQEPMTVKESQFAQSLTVKPVKGMLTGPITILNWSFVRDDLSREQVANQIALALRSEVEALEQAGIEMIQVDEPALREGLPLKARDQQSYLDWAVRAFRIATSTVKDTTQIHTHMCYCEFHDMIDSIKALDADVISIETSRSHGELIESFEVQDYDHGIGLGVYDIHSPRVPDVAEMEELIGRALRVLEPKQFWINPDCGLKTRGWAETAAALRHMVSAAESARAKLGHK